MNGSPRTPRTPFLRVELAHAGQACVANVIGEVDLATRGQVLCLEEPVRRHCGRLVLDLRDMTFIDSAGLGAIARLATSLESLALCNPRPLASRVLAIAGLDALLAPSATDEPLAGAPVTNEPAA